MQQEIDRRGRCNFKFICVLGILKRCDDGMEMSMDHEVAKVTDDIEIQNSALAPRSSDSMSTLFESGCIDAGCEKNTQTNNRPCKLSGYILTSLEHDSGYMTRPYKGHLKHKGCLSLLLPKPSTGGGY